MLPKIVIPRVFLLSNSVEITSTLFSISFVKNPPSISQLWAISAASIIFQVIIFNHIMIKELPSEPLTLTTNTKYLPTYTNYKSNTNSVTKYTVQCRALIIGKLQSNHSMKFFLGFKNSKLLTSQTFSTKRFQNPCF